MKNKKAILVISFGTSYKETREKTIGAIEADMRRAFPEYEFRRAVTSPTILRLMKEREGIEADSVEQALKRLAEDGFRTVIAQTTHMICGKEYEGVMAQIAAYRPYFDTLVCGDPLLTAEEDYEAVACALDQELAPYRNKQCDLVLMGHGTEHLADGSYRKLQQALTEHGVYDILLGTLEHSETMEQVELLLRARKTRQIVLAPFLVVAGSHALKDMAGDGANTWQTYFTKAGYEVECLMRGMGELEQIRAIYVEHAKRAERDFCCILGE